MCIYVCMYVCAVRNLESHKPKPEQLSSADAIRHIEGFVELQSKVIPPKSTEEVEVFECRTYVYMYICMYACLFMRGVCLRVLACLRAARRGEGHV